MNVRVAPQPRQLPLGVLPGAELDLLRGGADISAAAQRGGHLLVADGLRRYQVSVNGVAVGSVEEMGALESVLDQLKGQYVNENTISAEFVDDIQVEDVYSEEGQMTAEELQTALMANTTGDTTYTVVKGDTFNAIAYANDMSVSDLKALNPGIDINRLMIGDVLNVKEQIPLLSLIHI